MNFIIIVRTSLIRSVSPYSVSILKQNRNLSSVHKYALSNNKIVFQCYCSSSTINPNLQEFANDFEVDEKGILGDLDIETITNNDPKKMETLKLLLMKIDKMRNKNNKLPNNIEMKHWKELLEMPTITQQIKFLSFLQKLQARKEQNKLIKLEKNQRFKEFQALRKSQPKEVATTSSPLKYGLNHNTLFMRVRETTISNFYNYKLLDPLMYGPDIVFDFEYDSFMTRKELISSVGQVVKAWSVNRENLKPFNIILANLSNENKMYDKLKSFFPSADVDPSYPLNITRESYLDLYPRDQLVYLSPHAVNTVDHYDPTKTYIIGVMVDIVMNEPLSLAKAKKYGIQALKLPLDKYINWRAGGKHLQMNQVLQIMLDIKNGVDWKTALLRHLPDRKLMEEQPDQPKDESIKSSAQTIRRMYKKNKVHELIIDEERKIIN